jgi:pimeloyl-ACP methyl ester carboxylesterase
MTGTRTRTIDLDPGRSVEVTLAEAGTGRTALVLHGGGGPVTVQGIAAHLAGDMHALTPVHPGWDGTPRPPWLSSIGDLAAAYLRLLRDEGHQDVLVVGSSIGGWIGAEMAVRDEAGLISSLVLVDSVGVLVEGQPDPRLLRARRPRRGRVLVLRRRTLLHRPGHRGAGAGRAAGRQHGHHARLRRRSVHA